MSSSHIPKYLSAGAIKQLSENPSLNTTIKVDLVLQITKIEDLPEKKDSAQKLK